jgi:hypothetical protein
VCDRYADSIDHLSELFLEAGLLKASHPDRRLERFAPDYGEKFPPKKPVASVTMKRSRADAVGMACCPVRQ